MTFDMMLKVMVGCIEDFGDFGMRWVFCCMKNG